MYEQILNLSQSTGFAWAVVGLGAMTFVLGALRSGPSVLWGDMFADDADD